jgi:hypothetical protein
MRVSITESDTLIVISALFQFLSAMAKVYIPAAFLAVPNSVLVCRRQINPLIRTSYFEFYVAVSDVRICSPVVEINNWKQVVPQCDVTSKIAIEHESNQIEPGLFCRNEFVNVGRQDNVQFPGINRNGQNAMFAGKRLRNKLERR